MLIISNAVHLPDHEIELNAIRAQAPAGRTSTRSPARCTCASTSRPVVAAVLQERLLALNDQRISGDGVVVIKAQQYRTQEQNREDALERLAELIRSVAKVQKARRRPSLRAARSAGWTATKRGAVKAGRGKVDF